jgi:hypothetical protein
VFVAQWLQLIHAFADFSSFKVIVTLEAFYELVFIG